MDFTADHYYEASHQRLRQAQELYSTRNNLALCMYVAGAAVECMLRAHLLKKKKEFESRHDVSLLLNESGMVSDASDILNAKGFSREEIENHCRSLESAVNMVSVLWHNNYRYASEARLLAHLKRKKLYRKIKGDLLKANAFRLLNAARTAIERGKLQWH